MSRDYHALTEMMNELHNPRGLKRFADDVFQGVVPIRNRDKYDRIVQSTVTLLASGIPKNAAVKALFDAQELQKDELWVRQVVDRVLDMAAIRAAQRADKAADIGTSLRLALSYAATNDARATPSDELLKEAETSSLTTAGTEAMLDVMRFLSNPHAYALTPETIRLTAALNQAVNMRARDLVSAEHTETVTDVEVDADGRILVSIEGSQRDRVQVNEPEADEDLGMTI